MRSSFLRGDSRSAVEGLWKTRWKELKLTTLLHLALLFTTYLTLYRLPDKNASGTSSFSFPSIPSALGWFAEKRGITPGTAVSPSPNAGNLPLWHYAEGIPRSQRFSRGGPFFCLLRRFLSSFLSIDSLIKRQADPPGQWRFPLPCHVKKLLYSPSFSYP